MGQQNRLSVAMRRSRQQVQSFGLVDSKRHDGPHGSAMRATLRAGRHGGKLSILRATARDNRAGRLEEELYRRSTCPARHGSSVGKAAASMKPVVAHQSEG